MVRGSSTLYTLALLPHPSRAPSSPLPLSSSCHYAHSIPPLLSPPQVHRQCLGGSLRVMVTQAEVIYIDDVRATACSSSSPQPPEDAATPPPSSSDPPSFYDPLLHLPPKLLEEERRRSCSSALWSTDGLVILVPLRLGLNGLNPIYIPGRREGGREAMAGVEISGWVVRRKYS